MLSWVHPRVPIMNQVSPNSPLYFSIYPVLSTGKGPHEQNPPLSLRLGPSLESSLTSSLFLIPISFHSVIPPAGFLDTFPQSAVLVEGHLLILHLNCFITLTLLQVMPPLAARGSFQSTKQISLLSCLGIYMTLHYFQAEVQTSQPSTQCFPHPASLPATHHLLSPPSCSGSPRTPSLELRTGPIV